LEAKEMIDWLLRKKLIFRENEEVSGLPEEEKNLGMREYEHLLW